MQAPLPGKLRGESPAALRPHATPPRISTNAPQGCKLLLPAFYRTAAAALSGAMRKRIRLSGVGIQKRMREAACWRRRPGAAILRQRPAFVPLIRASTRSVLAYRAASPPSEEHFGRPSGKTAPCGRLPPHLRNTWCRRRYRSIGPKCERLRCGFIFALPLPAGLNGCGPSGPGRRSLRPSHRAFQTDVYPAPAIPSAGSVCFVLLCVFPQGCPVCLPRIMRLRVEDMAPALSSGVSTPAATRAAYPSPFSSQFPLPLQYPHSRNSFRHRMCFLLDKSAQIRYNIPCSRVLCPRA